MSESQDENQELNGDSERRPRRRLFKRIVLWLVAALALVMAVVIGALLYFHIPQNAAGMAAKSVCSAAFVGGRDADAAALMEQDVLPASVVLEAISTDIDTSEYTVTAKFLGLFSRQASLVSDRGCVLDLEADPSVEPYVPQADETTPWPSGDAPADSALDPALDLGPLQAVVDAAFEGSGDSAAANARGVAVVQDGQLLLVRDGAGIDPGVALHGWSATKTVAAMLAYKKFDEVGLDLETPVVEAFPDGREPPWVADWREDDRAEITVADLLYMRPGLKIDESYDPWGSVVQMLYGEDDMAAWAGDQPSEFEAGSHWEYLSATSVLLASVVRAQFDTDAEYWAYPETALFDPVGLGSTTLETDTAGTWVGSSYQWSSVTDWARLGQLMLADGDWQGEQVLPPGWWDLAATPAVESGEGHGYGAQSWILGDPVGGECKGTAGVPEDTLAMEGHWGQLVAMVPSQEAVIVRLGWTFNSDEFDGCQFVADVLAALDD